MSTTGTEDRKGAKMATTINLHASTYGRKTYIAELLSDDDYYGFERDFIAPTARNNSRSGKTGTWTYEIGRDGVYEIQDFKTRRYIQVDGGEATDITKAQAVELIA